MTIPVDRFDFTFSPSGRYGACLRCTDDRVTVERWDLSRCDPAAEVTTVAADLGTSALPLDDGSMVVLQRDVLDPAQPHRVAVLDAWTGTCRPVDDISALLGAYLLPSPEPGTLAFVVARHDPEHSSIWRLPPDAHAMQFVVRVPGCLAGGVWLDGTARVLAANQTSPSNRASGVVVDLVDGTWRRMWSMSRSSNDRIALFSPRSRMLVLTTDAAGEERLGWGTLGERDVSFPDALYRPGNPWRAWALDPPGERILLHEVSGATSRLSVFTPADEGLRTLDGPAGIASGPACWAGEFLRFRFSTPTCPPTLATVMPDARQAQWWLGDEDGQATWPGAELVQLGGADDPMEGIVYGGPAWRHAPHLVVALHGGPLSAWGFEFDPLFQALVAAGAAVVAPNYRGSTGYGRDHLKSVIGSWGGPDLDDVVNLAERLARERASLGLPKPVVLGGSYGGYLALLAACNRPELWSRCVALAPFLSGPRLHADTPDAAVRERIERLGGLEPGDDPDRPRDVLQASGTLTAPVLLVHGIRDLTVPVNQSRTLVRHLAAAGGDAAVEYVELDTDHSDVTLARRDALRRRIARFCLSRSRPARLASGLVAPTERA